MSIKHMVLASLFGLAGLFQSVAEADATTLKQNIWTLDLFTDGMLVDLNHGNFDFGVQTTTDLAPLMRMNAGSTLNYREDMIRLVRAEVHPSIGIVETGGLFVFEGLDWSTNLPGILGQDVTGIGFVLQIIGRRNGTGVLSEIFSFTGNDPQVVQTNTASQRVLIDELLIGVNPFGAGNVGEDYYFGDITLEIVDPPPVIPLPAALPLLLAALGSLALLRRRT